MAFTITRFSDTIWRIALTPPIDGFDDFICCWVWAGAEKCVVDPGPSATASELLTALREIGVNNPDYILLTHIHIDHAGGIGEIAAAFPETPVVCHKKAVPHLIDPEKLWNGTVKTLGDTGRAYGRISPVPEMQLLKAEDLSSQFIKAILTPGHAAHHVSFMTPEKILLAGEAGGVNIAFDKNREYLRPATPPKFSLETAVASIDRLLAENPEIICYGHTALRTNAAELLNRHKDQLFFWKKIIKKEIEQNPQPNLTSRCADALIKTDPLLGELVNLPSAICKREKFFLENSIKGFVGYLKDTGAR